MLGSAALPDEDGHVPCREGAAGSMGWNWDRARVLPVMVWQHVADDHEVLVVSMFAIETPDFSKFSIPRAAALCGCSIL